MNEIKIISPVYNRVRIDGPVRLGELPLCGKINLRGDAGNKQFLAAVTSVLGIVPPIKPNTRHMGDTTTVFWLGPDEWLCHGGLLQTPTLVADLRSRLAGIHSAVVEVSDYYTVLRLDGSGSADLLSRACPLDLHPSVFNKGACAQTRFGHASILLHKISNAPSFEIQVRWSFAEYVWDYLVSGMRALAVSD